MAADVVSLDDRRPHETATVKCGACGHRWQAVWPTGATAPFECPSCHVMAGAVDRPSPPRVRGVGRDPDDARTLTVAMSGELSDDDLRSIHDYLRGWRP